jgi:hypothetical protein
MADSITPKDFDIGLHDRVPDGEWCIVDVVFPATAHTDFQIPHTLSPPSQEQVEYTVLRQATPGTVYEDRSATRTAWGPGFIILRSDTGSWTGRLLLRVLKSPLLWTPGQSIVYTPPAGVTYPIALNKGGTAADLSATGPGYLKQATLGAAVTVASSIAAGDIGSGLLALARGGTNKDMSSTGGTGQFLKQKTSGGAVSVETIATADLGSGSASSSNFLRGDLSWAVANVGATCLVSKTANQTWTGTAWTLLTWNTEVYDTDGFHDNSTNNSRITIPTGMGGKYYIWLYSAIVDAAAGGGGFLHHQIRINAGGVQTSGGFLNQTSAYGPNGGLQANFTASIVYDLAATDYVEAFAISTQAGASVTYYSYSGFGIQRLT